MYIYNHVRTYRQGVRKKNNFATQGRFNKIKVKKTQKVTPVPPRNVKKAKIDHHAPKFSTIR
jgi:hypothetical protein